MTRRDYIAIAADLAANRPSNFHTTAGDPGCGLWLGIREALAVTMAADNPNFNRGLFLTASEA